MELKKLNELQTNQIIEISTEFASNKTHEEHLKSKIKLLQQEKEILQKEKEKHTHDSSSKSRNYEIAKEQILNFKDALDKIIVKMSNFKNYFQKSQIEKLKLIEERKELTIRAAAGFENLTPRPNFLQICEEKNLNFSNFVNSLGIQFMKDKIF